MLGKHCRWRLELRDVFKMPWHLITQTRSTDRRLVLSFLRSQYMNLIPISGSFRSTDCARD